LNDGRIAEGLVLDSRQDDLVANSLAMAIGTASRPAR